MQVLKKLATNALVVGLSAILVTICFVIFNFAKGPSVFAIQNTTAQTLCEQGPVGSTILSSPGLPTGAEFTYHGQVQAGKIILNSIEYNGKTFCTTAKFSSIDGSSELNTNQKYNVKNLNRSPDGWLVVVQPEVS